MKNVTENRIRGELRYNEPMSKHTSWRVGGIADVYFKPVDIDDIAVFLATYSSEFPIYWIGLGSNLLVRDAGIRGTVIVTSGLLNGLQILDEQTIRAEAGVACPKVARFAAKQNAIGAEFLAGIPGTIGGALAMNAGAFGGETWNKIVAVETIDRQGGRHHRFPEEYDVGYRCVKGPDNEWFVAAHFKLNQGDGEASLAKIKALLEKRNVSQPTNQASCGSVFRNPDNDYAARLIESSGLKGLSIGGASVSEKHSNFIVNTGNACAADIEALINLVEEKVKAKHGVSLQREVHFLGEANEH
ncbi:MAG TPA: UDP-N-acetylmuramate dehydrogenase [Gammaproteobacteria bacterium]|nr:UDP-N-acetylmuramate dehydrogenase [Gammaproteobacteria bacterium]